MNGSSARKTLSRRSTFRNQCGFIRRGCSRLGVAQEFLTEDRHITRGFDSQTNLAAINVNHGDADVVADVDLFTQFSAQYQHVATLLRALCLNCFYCSPRLCGKAPRK